MSIQLQVKGLDDLIKKLDKFPDEIEANMGAAGEEAAKAVLSTQGLQNYPPETEANMAPTPYWIRGRGMQRGGVRVPEYNDMSSQRLGTRWTVKTINRVNTLISNSADYAQWVYGEAQSSAMGRIGWRKLFEVAEQMTGKITEIYAAWVERAQRRVGLK